MSTIPATRPPTQRRSKQIEETLDVLYRRRWIVAATVAVVLALAVAYVFTQTPVYRTSAYVLVDLERAQGSAVGPVGTGDGASALMGPSRSVATELFVLNSSRRIEDRVQERLQGDDGRMPPGNVGFSQANRDVSSAIQISATSTSPEAAAALANAYAEEYVEQTRTSSRSYLTATREFLEDQAQRLRSELNAAEGEVAGQMAQAGRAALGGNSLMSQLASLRAQRDEARIALQTSQYRLESINDQLSDITPRLADRISSTDQQRIAQIDQTIAQLQEEYRTVFEPRIARGESVSARAQEIQRRLSELQREKDQLVGQFTRDALDAGGIVAPQEALSFITNLRSSASQEQIQIDGIEGQLGVLNRRIAELESELGRVPSQTTAMERVARDRNHAVSMYESVVSQLQQVKIQEESEPGYARVLKEASVPRAPLGSRPYKTLALALLGGLGLGLVLAVSRDKMDNRVHKPEHLTALGVPVLEAVPDLEATIQDEYDGAETIEVDGRPVTTELVTLHSPLAPASETYRHLRTAVQFSRPDVLVQTIVVSSAGAGEGKSTTASNLAVTFAQAGRRTVLLDADIRRPRIHEVFGIDPTPGLAQMLGTAHTSPDTLRAWLDGAFKSSIDDLYVVPTGAVAAETGAAGDDWTVVNNPSEMLGSVGFRAFLQALHEVVDVVVIDTPPVLAATDAVLLATQADATLLVAGAGKTKAGDVEQALSHLSDVGARVVGAVLNRFSLKNALGYAYTYGHYSRYGPYSKYGPGGTYGSYGGSRTSRKRRAEAKGGNNAPSEA